MIDKAKIKQRRLKLGYSLTDAAVAAGWGKVGRTRWHDIEAGRRNNLTMRTIERMAEVLKIKTKDLLGN